MSSYLCSDATFKIIAVSANLSMHTLAMNIDEASANALELCMENHRGLRDRYRDPMPTDVTMSVTESEVYVISQLDPFAVIGAVNEYSYQACDSKEWKSSPARDICDAATYHATAKLKHRHGSKSNGWNSMSDKRLAELSSKAPQRLFG